MLCLINPLTNSEPPTAAYSLLRKGGFREFLLPVDSKSPLALFSKGEYGKTDSEISQRISETLH